MPSDNFEVDYFVSRRGTHAAVAQEVAQVLMAAGHTVKVQDYDIPHGANFVLEMHDALVKCRNFVAILSSDYDAAVFTGAEWTNFYADAVQSGGKRRFVVIRVEDFEPRGLFKTTVRGDLVGVTDVQERQQRILAAAEGRSLANPSLPWLFDNVPPRVNDFTGREARLQELHELLMQARAPAAITQAALYGLGGIGKTSLAIEYAHVYGKHYAGVWWAGAETRTQLIASLATLAGKLDAKLAEERDQEAAALEGLNRLARTTKPYLLVYDNVESPETLHRLLPATGARVVITTRYSEWGGIAKEVKLDLLPSADAEAFLQKRAGRADVGGARSLAEALGYLPLALDHAGAYCRLTAMSFDTYRNKIDSLTAKLPKSARHDSVSATFDLAIEKAINEHPDAELLLGFLSFLAPERAPLDLINDSVVGEESRAEALATLVGVSLVEHSSLPDGDPATTVHRLVQSAMRRRLSKTSKIDDILHHVFDRVVEAFPSESRTQPRKWPRCAVLLQHVMALRPYVAEHEFVEIAAAKLFNLAALYLYGRAAYDEAEPLLRHAVELTEKNYGRTNADVAGLLNNLANLLAETERHVEAEQLLREVISIGENTAGTESVLVATSRNNLANLLVDSGRLIEAETLYREVIAIGETVLGREHLDVAVWLNNLANVLSQFGRYDEAEALFAEALATRLKNLGAEDPSTAISEWSLAVLLMVTGRKIESISRFERALSVFEKTLGAEHPTTLECRYQYSTARDKLND